MRMGHSCASSVIRRNDSGPRAPNPSRIRDRRRGRTFSIRRRWCCISNSSGFRNSRRESALSAGSVPEGPRGGVAAPAGATLVLSPLGRALRQAARGAPKTAAIAHDGVQAHPKGTNDLVDRPLRPTGRTRGLAESRTTGSQHAAAAAVAAHTAARLPDVVVPPPSQGGGGLSGGARKGSPDPRQSLEPTIAMAAKAETTPRLDNCIMGP